MAVHCSRSAVEQGTSEEASASTRSDDNGRRGTKQGRHGGYREVPLYDSVEAVERIGVVVDGAAHAIGLDERVAATHHITLAALLLGLRVTRQRVLSLDKRDVSSMKTLCNTSIIKMLKSIN